MLETVQRVYTYHDLVGMPEEQRYEVIDGELYDMTAAPSTRHQAFSRNLQWCLHSYIYQTGSGELFNAPIDVVFDRFNVVQPDLIFISTGKRHIIQDKYVQGAPDVAIEILSPTTLSKDLATKKELYAKFGVLEYWIVDPFKDAIEVFSLKNGLYELRCSATTHGLITSEAIKGFQLSLEEIIPKAL